MNKESIQANGAAFVPVIDLFAGPGGLGEGFSAYETESSEHPFQIALSVEKDVDAHKTLMLRSFYRQFREMPVPEDYYSYLRGDISRDDLSIRWSQQWKAAEIEALHAELGKPEDDAVVTERIYAGLGAVPATAWVLIGGPPCQAYSMVGRNRRRSVDPEFENDHRHFLYREYLQILARHSPPVFVIENVPGMLSTVINGANIFDKILQDLHKPAAALTEDKGDYKPVTSDYEYSIYSLVPADRPGKLKPTDFVVNAEEYGVPQARHRVILLGVRNDLHAKPGVLVPQPSKRPVSSVIGDLPRLRSSLSKETDSDELWSTLLQSVASQDWFVTITDQKVRDEIMNTASQIRHGQSVGVPFVKHSCCPMELREWFLDERLLGVCNHIAKAHMRSDLYRYMFAACYAKAHGTSPRMKNFPKALWPKHVNVEEAVKGDMFDDRFRVQLAGQPSKTITSHISKDGHYNIHYDATQCRSLTVREAARLQTFPDNYLFEGSRTAQYRQVGNAVPPYLARQIAGVIYPLLRNADLV